MENGIVVGWDLKGGQSWGTPSEAYEVQTPLQEPAYEVQTPLQEPAYEVQTPLQELLKLIPNDGEAARLESEIAHARALKEPLGHLLLVGSPGFSAALWRRLSLAN